MQTTQCLLLCYLRQVTAVIETGFEPIFVSKCILKRTNVNLQLGYYTPSVYHFATQSVRAFCQSLLG